MSWVKGDRLKVTLEITAAEPSDEDVTDIWFKAGNGIGRFYFNQDDIVAAGGSVTVEVLPKPVELPTKKWASVTIRSIGGDEILVIRVGKLLWESLGGVRWAVDEVTKRYVRTISEGVDE